jgi:hypothetical protein
MLFVSIQSKFNHRDSIPRPCAQQQCNPPLLLIEVQTRRLPQVSCPVKLKIALMLKYIE